jgi:hypothetical protein
MIYNENDDDKWYLFLENTTIYNLYQDCEEILDITKLLGLEEITKTGMLQTVERVVTVKKMLVNTITNILSFQSYSFLLSVHYMVFTIIIDFFLFLL